MVRKLLRGYTGGSALTPRSEWCMILDMGGMQP